MINKDRLKNICADIGVELDAQAFERFELFASMLAEKNKVLNLTAITDPEGIAVKHFADTLAEGRKLVGVEIFSRLIRVCPDFINRNEQNSSGF